MITEIAADEIISQIDAIVDGLSKLSCGDSGCMFNVTPGQHTNGGCRCLKHLPAEKRIKLEIFNFFYKNNRISIT
jgi:hypothetical protein